MKSILINSAFLMATIAFFQVSSTIEANAADKFSKSFSRCSSGKSVSLNYCATAAQHKAAAKFQCTKKYKSKLFYHRASDANKCGQTSSRGKNNKHYIVCGNRKVLIMKGCLSTFGKAKQLAKKYCKIIRKSNSVKLVKATGKACSK